MLFILKTFLSNSVDSVYFKGKQEQENKNGVSVVYLRILPQDLSYYYRVMQILGLFQVSYTVKLSLLAHSQSLH